MPTLADDDLAKWVYHHHTRAKHEVLSYYLEVWTKIVSETNRTIHVFDCFAGRGDYIPGEDTAPVKLQEVNTKADFPGSPQIILDELAQRNHLFEQANCYLIEPTEENRDSLHHNLPSESDLPENLSVEVFDASFENDILDIIHQSEAWHDFGFFFIDPFGLKSLEYDTVSRISSTRGFDCIITLMTKELIRWQESEAHADAFERLYGIPDWKEELRVFEPEHLETAEAEYYCDRLEDGGVEFPLAYMTTRGDSRELMYDLVLTTNDEKGLEAMKESLARCGTDYALAYAPERMDIGGMEQAKLARGGVMTEEKKAKSYLLTRFAGETYQFGELVHVIFRDPERLYARSIKRDYRKYLKEMDNDGEIEILEREGPEGGLPDHYTIQFPELDLD